MNKIIFNIFRFNPEKEKTSYYKEYAIEPPVGATVLDCLNLIKGRLDGTLTFRMSCRSAICGSCAMRINGHARLACNTQSSSLAKANPYAKITIEPLGNMKVIKDLVVDMTPFWDKINAITPWLISDTPEPKTERLQKKEEYRLIDPASTCILCAACNSDCQSLKVDKDFIGPSALCKSQRFIDDSRDRNKQERIKEMHKPHGMWDCTHCMECIERCPKEASPMERISALRIQAMQLGLINNNGARHARAFSEIVGHSGLLDENLIPIKSVGYFNFKEIIGLIPVGIRMFLKGKNPPIIHKPIKEVEDVRRIYKRLMKK